MRQLLHFVHCAARQGHENHTQQHGSCTHQGQNVRNFVEESHLRHISSFKSCGLMTCWFDKRVSLWDVCFCLEVTLWSFLNISQKRMFPLKFGVFGGEFRQCFQLSAVGNWISRSLRTRWGWWAMGLNIPEWGWIGWIKMDQNHPKTGKFNTHNS